MMFELFAVIGIWERNNGSSASTSPKSAGFFITSFKDDVPTLTATSTLFSQLLDLMQMGRPKLYHNEDDRLQAKRVYSKTYYAKNRAEISVKNKARYRRKRDTRAPIDTAADSSPGPYERLRCMSHDTQSTSAHEARPSYTSPSPEPIQTTIEGLESELMQLVNNSLAGFLEVIIGDIVCSTAASSRILLTRTTKEARELLTHARALYAKGLQMHGCRSELRNLERTEDRIVCVVQAFEEVSLFAQADTRELLRGRQCGKLLYQTHSDITPIT